MKKIATFLSVLASCLAMVSFTARDARAAEVIAFGDSWAEFGADELGEIFVINGHPEINVDNQGVGGTTADFWTYAAWTLPYVVSENPDAEWMWLSLGGNDVFAYYSAGAGETAAASIDEDLRFLLDELFTYYPRMKVVMFGYDFPNFEQSTECWTYAALYFPGMLTPDINRTFLNDIGEVQKAIAADYPNVTYVSLWGTLQAAGGIPNAPNVLFPSPAQYMADCIHANDQGYRLIMQGLYDAYFAQQLEETAPSCSGERLLESGRSGSLAYGVLLLVPWGLFRMRRNRRRSSRLSPSRGQAS